MRQVSKQSKKKPKRQKKKKISVGTSKLETDFAHDFLDKLGVQYIWQFEAKDIKRWYDFYLPKHNLIIEIDGGYWHSDPRLVNQNELNNIQKHNKRVDEYKNKWALMHGIPIMRIWEKDIRENPKTVLNELKERLKLQNDKQEKLLEMKKRHNNNIQ